MTYSMKKLKQQLPKRVFYAVTREEYNWYKEQMDFLDFLISRKATQLTFEGYKLKVIKEIE